MVENWLPVVGYEGYYEVSDLGRVRSRKGILKPMPTTHKPPRFRVELYSPASYARRSIHIIVLEAFVGPRPKGAVACHNDGNPSNCAVLNLRWDTQKANLADRIEHGTHNKGSRHNMAKVVEGDVPRMRDMRRLGCTVKSIGDWFGISRAQTGLILSGRYWTHV